MALNPVLQSLFLNYLAIEKWEGAGWVSAPISDLQTSLGTVGVKAVLCYPRTNSVEVILNDAPTFTPYVLRFRLPSGIWPTGQNMVAAFSDLLNYPKPGNATNITVLGTFLGWSI